MPTLWQILTKKKEEKVEPKPFELQVYNPLGLMVGDQVRIDTLDMEDFAFKVVSIKEVRS